MAVICNAKRGTKCIHKLNSQSPEGLGCIVCGIEASPEQCIYSNKIDKWVKNEGEFALKEVV